MMEQNGQVGLATGARASFSVANGQDLAGTESREFEGL